MKATRSNQIVAGIATALVMSLGGCGGGDGMEESCTVTDNGDGTSTITCDDGTSVTVDNTSADPAVLVRVDTEPAGDNCAIGGLAIHVGADTDGNGTIDDAEITSTTYVCNGGDGADGTDGTDGTNGTDGTATLVRIEDEAPGTNCADGGLAVLVGPDTDGDGVLDDDEVTSTTYVCDGADGTDAIPTLVRVDVEAPGSNCADGGQAIHIGPDTNGNGVLDTSEITSTSYACNGADGSDGSDGIPTLVRVDPEPAGTNCTYGGQAVHVGPDTNGNGTLDTSEITSTTYVCDGSTWTTLIPGRIDVIMSLGNWSVRCLAWSGSLCIHPQMIMDCTVCSTYTSCGIWHDITDYNNGGRRTSENFCAIATGNRTVTSESSGGTATAPRGCGWAGTHPICEAGRATYHAAGFGISTSYGLLLNDGYCDGRTTLLRVDCAGW